MIALVGLSLLAFVIATVLTVAMVIWEWPYMGLFILSIPGVVAIAWRRRALLGKYPSN
jgi:hypothetical protein